VWVWRRLEVRVKIWYGPEFSVWGMYALTGHLLHLTPFALAHTHTHTHTHMFSLSLSLTFSQKFNLELECEFESERERAEKRKKIKKNFFSQLKSRRERRTLNKCNGR